MNSAKSKCLFRASVFIHLKKCCLIIVQALPDRRRTATIRRRRSKFTREHNFAGHSKAPRPSNTVKNDTRANKTKRIRIWSFDRQRWQRSPDSQSAVKRKFETNMEASSDEELEARNECRVRSLRPRPSISWQKNRTRSECAPLAPKRRFSAYSTAAKLVRREVRFLFPLRCDLSLSRFESRYFFLFFVYVHARNPHSPQTLTDFGAPL